jgi:hypothetical protein
MSWSVSDKLTKQVRVELEQLSRLVEENLPIIGNAEKISPSKVEISALAAFLHSFYTGIENIFGRIYAEMHGKKAAGEAWHKHLLQAMSEETGQAAPVISRDLCDILSEYLTFRHVFRQAYTFNIRWEKMKPLVSACKATFTKFSEELSTRFNLPSNEKA